MITGPTVTYCGRRISGSEPRHVLYRNGREWKPDLPDSRENWWTIPLVWGESTEGARALAWALLADTMKNKRIANKWYIEFTQQVIRNLGGEWFLLGTDVRGWFASVKPTSLFMEGSENGETR